MINIKTTGTWTTGNTDKRIFGHFIESGFGRQVNGMWSEMLYNRAFRKVPPYEYYTWEWLGFYEPLYNENAPFWHSGYEEFDWQYIGEPETRYTLGNRTYKGKTNLCLKNKTEGACGLYQKGIHLQQGRAYQLRLLAGVEGSLSQAGLNGFAMTEHNEKNYPVIVTIGDHEKTLSLSTVSKSYEWSFTASQTALVDLSINFNWQGELILSCISMMPADNIDGWRCDVIEKLKEVAPPVVRFPGGCFVSFYDWESSIGNRDSREPMPSYYWGGLEENDVGLDEFIRLSELVGFEPQICFNMMTSTPFKARQMVEYLNAPANTGMGRLRMLNGHEKPYNVRLFEMDNEPARKWTAEQYAEQCVLFSREMRLADNNISFMFAAYTHAFETLAPMLAICGKDIDYVIYRQGTPEFVSEALAVIRTYNKNNGTNLKLVNTEWLAPCASIEPFDDPDIPTDFRWRGKIPNNYKEILSTQQRSWNYALNGAHRLLDYISYGSDFTLANFNNMCNTWGQNVIEATKDSCYLSNMGHVFSFFNRHFVPCIACETETGDERVFALLTRQDNGKEKLFIINHASAAFTIHLPEGHWQLSEGLTADNRLAYATETGHAIKQVKAAVVESKTELDGLSLLCFERIDN